MKIVKTILKYLMYGTFLFIMSGIMFSMIKNSDNSAKSKKIFDDTRNFAKQPSKENAPTTKGYNKNKIAVCANSQGRVEYYSKIANKYNMEKTEDACKMKSSLSEVIKNMKKMQDYSCSQFNDFNYKTYTNLQKTITAKCGK